MKRFPCLHTCLTVLIFVFTASAHATGTFWLNLQSEQPAYENQITSVSASVAAVDDIIAGARLILNLPSGGDIEFLSVNGENIEPQNTCMIGDLSPGQSISVTWGIRLSAWGVKTVSVDAVSTDLNVVGVSASCKKSVHKPDTLDAKIALVDLGDTEGDAALSEIEAAGWLAVALTPDQVTAGSLDASAYPVTVIYAYSSAGVVSTQTSLGFTEAIKTYMEAGGSILLYGTAAELLDTLGITENAFNSTYVNTSYWRYLTIQDVTHPVSEGWTSGQTMYLFSTQATYAGYISTVDSSLGMDIIGYSRYSSSYKTYGEVAYGSGKAMFMPGRLGGNGPQDNLRTLFMRSLDYLLTRDYGALQVDVNTGGIGIQDNTAQVKVDVYANGGYPVPGAVATLTIPSGATITGVTVDDTDVPVSDVISLGDMSDGDHKTIIWSADCTTGWGINRYDFNVKCESTDPRVEVATETSTKTIYRHKENRLSHPLALVDLGDTEGDAALSEIEAAGWQAVALAPDQVAAGSLDASHWPVTVIYAYSSSGVVSDQTSLGFTEAVKAYMEAGGSILLYGTAAELLDTLGITANAFNSTYVNTSYWRYLTIQNVTHPVSEGWTSGQNLYLFSTQATYAGYISTVDSSTGMDIIGYSRYSSSYKTCGEVAYGSGKAMFMPGRFGGNGPQDNLRTLFMRSLDYLVGQSNPVQGKVILDTVNYQGVTGKAKITIYDPDADINPGAGNDTIVVHVYSDSDENGEDVTLYEDASVPGLFLGFVGFEETLTDSNGNIFVHNGDQIFVTYQEETAQANWDSTSEFHTGIVSFDSDHYTSVDVVATIELKDPDLNITSGPGNDLATVIVGSISDPQGETLILYEDPYTAGIFSGIIGFESAIVPDNGKISVSDGEQIAVAYSDSKDDTGASQTISNTALWHKLVPGTFNLQIDVGGISIQEETAQISFTVSSADGYITGARLSLTSPSQTVLKGLSVDGNAVDATDIVTLGNIPENETRTVVWTVNCPSNWGINRFNFEGSAVSIDPDVAVTNVSGVKTIYRHKENALSHTLALVDLGDAEGDAALSEIGAAGWQAVALTPDQLAAGSLNVSAYPVTVIYAYSSAGVVSAQTSPDFTEAVKTYMEAGGSILLYGTAAELLDTLGITENAFNSTYVNTSYWRYLTIQDVTHPVSEGWTSGQTMYLFSTQATYAGYISTVDSSLGMDIIGYSRYSSSYKTYGEVAYGSGKAMFMPGRFGGNGPQDNLRTLFMRSLDYLLTRDYGALQIDVNTGSIGIQDNTVQVQVDVYANGGYSVPGAAATLTIPSGVTITGVTVDGADVSVSDVISLGDMSDGDHKTIIWSADCTTGWGINRYDFNVTCESTDPRVEAATETSTKTIYRHKENALSHTLAVVDLGDAEGDAALSEIEAAGWLAAALTPDQVTAGSLDASAYPVTVIYAYSSAGVVSTQTSLGFTEAIKTYMEAGGSILLYGTAAELLDTLGITENAFNSTYVNTSYWRYLTIQDVTHPVSEGWTSGQTMYLFSTQATYAGYISTVDSSLGMDIIGYSRYSSSYKTYGEVAYGSGKAMFMPGRLGGNGPQDNLRTLFMRSLDYLLTRDYGALQVDVNTGGIGIQDNTAQVKVDVYANGGYPVPGAVATLTIPSGATITGVTVDDTDVPVSDVISLGDMSDGDHKTIIWSADCTTGWGINRYDFNVKCESTDPRVEVATETSTKTIYRHKENRLSHPLALVDLGDTEGDAALSEIEAAGWQAVALAPDQVAAGSLDASHWPVTVIYAYSSSGVVSDQTSLGFTEAVKAYMEAGGSILLYGTAAELLDTLGITANAFNSTYVNTSYWRYLTIQNVTHPVSEGWTSGQNLYLFSTQATYAGYISTVDSSTGMDIIGYSRYSSSYKTCGEVAYGSGKAMFMPGRFGGNGPQDNLRTLFMRSLDYLVGQSNPVQGKVILDTVNYQGVTGKAKITIYDPDADINPGAGNDTIVVHVYSDSDENGEDVTLYEDASVPGLFLGFVRFEETLTDSNGNIFVHNGDQIFVTYQEETAQANWDSTSEFHTGIVSFDSDHYTSVDVVATIELKDPDLNITSGPGNDLATVIVGSISDPQGETLILYEDPYTAGIFSGIIGFESAIVPDNGKISVSDGEQIAVAYSDSKDDTGASQTISNTALWHKLVPGTFNLQIDVGGISIQEETAQISFTVSSADGYITGARLSLTSPSQTVLKGLSVDGNAVDATDIVTLGNIPENETRTVVWTVNCPSNWGINRFNFEGSAVSIDPDVAVTNVSGVKTIYRHKENALSHTLALVDLGDAEGDAALSEIGAAGWQAVALTPDQLAAGSLNVSAYPVTVIYAYSSAGVVSAQTSPDFTEAVKTYMEAGGSILLYGTAAELLDTLGITENAFNSTYVNTSYWRYLTIQDVTHPVSEGWTSGQTMYLFSTQATYAGYISTVDSSLGMDIIGYSRYSSSYKTYGEVAYGSGKAMFMPGRFGGNGPQDNLRTLFMRSLDYLLTRDYGALQIDVNTGSIGIQDNTVQVQVDVYANGGYSVPGAAATLTIPSGVTITGVTVDGADVSVSDVISLGDMSDGDHKTIIWSADCTTGWGINRYDFNVTCESTDPRVEAATETSTKTIYRHKENALSHTLAVVDLGDAEGDAALSEIEAAGWLAAALTPDQVTAGSLDASAYPVTVIYAYSSAGVVSTQTSLGFTEAIKTYMEAGGSILLYGTAAELLDTLGITENAFNSTYVNTSYWRYLTIQDVIHPVSEGWTSGQTMYLFSTQATYAGYISTVDSSLGMDIIGYSRYSSSYKTYGEVAYGSGKAMFMPGRLGGNGPQDNLRTLFMRSLDYLLTRDYGALTVQTSVNGINVQEESAEVTAMVCAVGGMPVENAGISLTKPDNVEIVGLIVDGNAIDTANQADLGDMANGDCMEVTWLVNCPSEWGYNSFDFSVSVLSEDQRVETVTDTVSKLVYIHNEESLGKTVALVNLNDTEDDALRAKLTDCGWDVIDLSPVDIALSPLTAPVTIVHYHGSTLPYELSSYGFEQGIASYLENGGTLILTGFAGEILDELGFTDSLFHSLNQASYLRTDETDHPINLGFSAGQQHSLNTSSFYHVYIKDSDIDAITGAHRIGYAWNSGDRNTMVEVPVGKGRVITFPGRFADSTPQPMLDTMLLRSVDYAIFGDIVPPAVLTAMAPDYQHLVIDFSEAVDFEPAENIENYFIDGDIEILKAVLSEDGFQVTLDTSDQIEGQAYEVVVSNITDLASPPNTIDNFNSAPFSGGHVPDLDLGIPENGLIFTPESCKSGDEITLRALVNNNGEKTLENLVIRFENSEAGLVQEHTISSISPGTNSYAQIQWDTTGLNGNFTVQVTVDPGNLIDEIDETNNIRSKSVFIDGIPPAGIENLTYEILEGHRIKLAWSPSSSEDASAYEILTDNGSGTLDNENQIDQLIHPASQWISSSLAVGKHLFAVRVKDAMGNKDTDPVIVTVDMVPDQSPPDGIADLQATVLSGGKIKLSWSHSTSPDVGKYNIYWDAGTGSMDYTTPMAVLDYPDQAYTTTDLEDGLYYFMVRAQDWAANEEKNQTRVTALIDTTPPQMVENLSYDLVSGNTVKLSWSPSTSGDVEYYMIYSDNGTGVLDMTNPIATLANDISSWTSDSLTASSYIFCVVCVDYSGNFHTALTIQKEVDLCFPDLVVQSVEWTPAEFKFGDTIQFKTVVKNNGTHETKKGFYVTFNCDGSRILSTYYRYPVQPGESVEITKDWRSNIVSKSYTLAVKADDIENRVIESDEDNNELTANFNILPDYMVAFATERQAYVAGEQVLFKTIVANSTDPSTYFSDADVSVVFELTNESGTLIDSGVVAFDNSSGKNEFYGLVDTAGFENGEYTFVVTASGPGGEKSESGSITVVDNIVLEVVTDSVSYDLNETVVISGSVKTENQETVSGVPVKIAVSARGFTRRFSAQTDENGNFLYQFTPNRGEGGLFQVSATCVANKLSRSADTQFTIEGLFTTPVTLAVDMTKNTSVTGEITITNIGTNSISGLNVSLEDLDETDLVTGRITTTDLVQSVDAGNKIKVGLEVTAQLDAPDEVTLKLRVSGEGVADQVVPITVSLHDPVPTPVIEPESFRIGGHPGDLMKKQITLTNGGYGYLNHVKAVSQDLDWVAVIGADIGTLAPSETAAFEVWANPDADITLGIYQARVILKSDEGQFDVNITIDVNASQTGEIRFNVGDDTGIAVSGANVTLVSKEEYTLETLAGSKTYNHIVSSKTDDQGNVVFSDVPAGDYTYQVDSSDHDSITGTTLIEPGQADREIEIDMVKNLVQVDWTVTPTEITDKYTIDLKLTFETDVPKPVLLISPYWLEFSMNENEEVTGQLAVTNPSLIEIKNITIDSSGLEGIDLEFDGPDGPSKLFTIDVIEPTEAGDNTVYIPYKARLKEGTLQVTRDLGSILGKGEYIYFSHRDSDDNPQALTGITNAEVPVKLVIPEIEKQLRIHPNYIYFTDYCSDAVVTAPMADPGIYKLTAYNEGEDTATLGPALGFTTSISAMGILSDAVKISTGVKLITALTIDDTISSIWTGDFDTSVLGPGENTELILAELSTTVLGFNLPDFGFRIGLLGFGYKWASEDFARPYVLPIFITTICDGSISIPIGFNTASEVTPGTGTSTGIGGWSGYWPSSSIGGWTSKGFTSVTIGGDVPEPTVHEVVKLKISQEAALEREAFDAEMEITPLVSDLDQVQARLIIRDKDGNVVNDLFNYTVNNLEGVEELDGSDTIALNEKGKIGWIIIPDETAGGTDADGQEYTIGAKLYFSVDGTPYEYETSYEPVVVKPQPSLYVDYYIPSQVKGNQPFQLKVVIHNDGPGMAENFRIKSAQPEIIENLSGLLIDFHIHGSGVGGAYSAEDMEPVFGNILPGQTIQGYWIMTSTLDGEFTQFSADMVHHNYLGMELNPLIKAVTTYFYDEDPDEDNDGLNDAWEIRYWGSTDIVDDPYGDYDQDTLTNIQEYRNGTDPTLKDSVADNDQDGIPDYLDDDDDNDGMPDEWESLYGLDPLVNDAHIDTDGDGFSNFGEYMSGTSPTNPNSRPDSNIIVYGNNLVRHCEGQVSIEIVAPKDGYYHVRLFDNLMLPPPWEWPVEKTGDVYLEKDQRHTFDLAVTPDTGVESFKVVLYKKTILQAVYNPIEFCDTVIKATDLIINVQNKDLQGQNGYLVFKVMPPNLDIEDDIINLATMNYIELIKNINFRDELREYYEYFRSVKLCENTEIPEDILQVEVNGKTYGAVYVKNGQVQLSSANILDPRGINGILDYNKLTFAFFFPAIEPDPYFSTLDETQANAKIFESIENAGQVAWWSVYFDKTEIVDSKRILIQNVTIMEDNFWTEGKSFLDGEFTGGYFPDHAEKQAYVLEPTVQDGHIKDNEGAIPLILVHGINGMADYWGKNKIPSALRDTEYDSQTYGYDVWEFYYRGQDTIEHCAVMLARAIEEVINTSFSGDDTGSAKQVNLLTHSYGGVVTRFMLHKNILETQDKISNLLMIAPPHHGSYTAYKVTQGDVLSLLQRYGVISSKYLDPNAPIYQELSPGSDRLVEMQVSEQAAGIFANIENTLVFAGTGGAMVNWFHDEAPGYDDGIVSVSSASLLDFKIDLGFIDFNHDELRKKEELLYLIKDYFYDDIGTLETGIDEIIRAGKPFEDEVERLAQNYSFDKEDLYRAGILVEAKAGVTGIMLKDPKIVFEPESTSKSYYEINLKKTGENMFFYYDNDPLSRLQAPDPGLAYKFMDNSSEIPADKYILLEFYYEDNQSELKKIALSPSRTVFVGQDDELNSPLDSDGDGIIDMFEEFKGTDPEDADTDDDALVDGGAGGEDLNANGIIDPGETDPLLPDTDGDGILDGTERGLTEPETPDTDLTAGNFIPDLHSSSTTDPSDADTDDDGILDGNEDINRDGKIESILGETDPGNPDSDEDGILDGTEIGLTSPQNPDATDLDSLAFIPDSDPETTTDPTNADTDGDGIDDGDEDLNKNGSVDPDLNETDPEQSQSIPGDIDRNGSIGESDYTVFTQVLGKCSEDLGYLVDADLDRDGCITNSDYHAWRLIFQETLLTGDSDVDGDTDGLDLYRIIDSAIDDMQGQKIAGHHQDQAADGQRGP